jgi:predicted Zn-dependent protease
MRNSKLQILAAFLGGVCTATITAQVSYSFAIFGTWPSAQATYKFGSRYPTDPAWRDRARSAGQTWTNVQSSSWAWIEDSNSNNKLTYAAIDGSSNTLAVTTSYFCGGSLCRFNMKMDNSESWYINTGTPGFNQIDLQSIITHEFGHALGLDHTTVGCSSTAPPTMCPFYTVGTTDFRTLQADDISGVSTNYP